MGLGAVGRIKGFERLQRRQEFEGQLCLVQFISTLSLENIEFRPGRLQDGDHCCWWRGFLHIFLCTTEELLHSGSHVPLDSSFLIHELVSQGQKQSPPCVPLAFASGL